MDNSITFGTTIMYGTAGGTPATEVDFKSITSLPKETPEKIDVSRVNQTSRKKVYRNGMSDVDDLAFMIGAEDTQLSALIAAVGTTHAWRVTFEGPNGYIQFDGDHTISLASAENSNEVLWEVRIRPTTDITYTPPV